MKNLTYKAVENSKNTSGESGNNPSGGSGQLTLAQKQNLIALAVEMGCTHFFTHLFMDTDAQMQANYAAYAANYNRLTLEEETQEWADVIHAAGLKHVMRGSWSGIKGNNDFDFVTYGTPEFIPLGTVAGAVAEGETTYCGKMWRFLTTNLGADHIEDGDILAPISEFTEYLSDADYVWFDTSGGTQAGVYNFFTTLHEVVDAYATSIGKTLGFFSIVNYSEYKSGYLNDTLPADTGVIPIDYYGHAGGYSAGQHVEPADYVADWIAVRNQVGGAGYPLFQTEIGGIFGDSWPTLGPIPAAYSRKIASYEESAHYQIQLWKAYRDDLIDENLMSGLSNWGFWSGQNSSIVYFSNGTYKLNYFGQIYANFIKGNGMARIPVAAEGNFSADAWGGRSIHF